jgi:hypothetical protein
MQKRGTTGECGISGRGKRDKRGYQKMKRFEVYYMHMPEGSIMTRGSGNVKKKEIA